MHAANPHKNWDKYSDVPLVKWKKHGPGLHPNGRTVSHLTSKVSLACIDPTQANNCEIYYSNKEPAPRV